MGRVCSRQTITTRRTREGRGYVDTVTSNDGTTIAFDRLGDGYPVIVVGGELCDRALTRPTAEELAKSFAVFNYDRRGRDDSGDNAPHAVEREIEDLEALIAQVEGTASVYGHSSGAALALHAAAAGLPIAKLVLHEPPYTPDGDEDRQRASRNEAKHIKTLLDEDRRRDAVEYLMWGIGMPQEMVEVVSQDPRVVAMAPTMAYDSEIMGDISRGGTVPAVLLDAVTVSTLVVSGGASSAWMIDVGRRLAESLPKGRHVILEGQEHVVPPEVLVPVLTEFFAH
jgi:pimeloyl-ACP methyl ester carboxylesterase